MNGPDGILGRLVEACEGAVGEGLEKVVSGGYESNGNICVLVREDLKDGAGGRWREQLRSAVERVTGRRAAVKPSGWKGLALYYVEP